MISHQTGTVEMFRRISNNVPYYSIKYDDGTSNTFVGENTLLRED
jgi:hypothetical protein